MVQGNTAISHEAASLGSCPHHGGVRQFNDALMGAIAPQANSDSGRTREDWRMCTLLSASSVDSPTD